METKTKNGSFVQLGEDLQRNNKAALQAIAEHTDAAAQTTHKTGAAKRLANRAIATMAGSAKLTAVKKKRVYETGMPSTLSHTGMFISCVNTFGTLYGSNNPLYTLVNLQTLRDDGYAAINDVGKADAKYKYAVSLRFNTFDGLQALCTRIINELIISGATEETIKQVRYFIRKLNGTRAVAKDKNDLEAKYNSVSQMSYAEQLENFELLIMMVEAEATYDPFVDALKVVALRAKADALRVANDAAQDAQAELEAARIARNHLFNDKVTGLVDVFLNAKKVVLAIFGASSEEYKQVRHLSFSRISER